MNQYNAAKHKKLIVLGKSLEKGVTHKLPESFIHSIIGTLDFFGASAGELQQAIFDLTVAKYKIFDVLGMMYSSEYYQAKPIYAAIEKLVDLYIAQAHVGGFAWFLRGHDLDIEEPHHCDDCIKSYDEFMSLTPEQRAAAKAKLIETYGNVIEI